MRTSKIIFDVDVFKHMEVNLGYLELRVFRTKYVDLTIYKGEFTGYMILLIPQTIP